jgi:hypothetical protein
MSLTALQQPLWMVSSLGLLECIVLPELPPTYNTKEERVRWQFQTLRQNPHHKAS